MAGEEQIAAQDDPQASLGEKMLSTAYKYDGWKMRINAIINVIVAVVFAFIGLVISLIFRTLIGLALVSPIVIICTAGAFYYWKRSKSLVRGKFD